MGSRPVWRVRDRATFDALRQVGRRARRGAVSVTFVPSAPSPSSDATSRPRVAFAVGRGVGSSVVRNRLRRRLRAVVDDLAGSPGGGVPAGTYLVAAGPEAVALSPTDLRAAVAGALEAATSGAAARVAG